MPEAFRRGALRADIFLPADTWPKGIVLASLSHGSDIALVESGGEDVRGCDGLITSNKDLRLAMRTADCAAICFGDGERIGIAHVGWRGLCAGLIEKMLPRFSAPSLVVYVAPFLHAFEIRKDFCYDRIAGVFGERFFRTEEGRTLFRFKDAVASLLPPSAAWDSRSMEDSVFPSFRRDKTRERLLTVASF